MNDSDAPTALPATHRVAESKTLGMLAFVFGLVALALSPAPFLDNVGIIFGFAAGIVEVIGIFKSACGMSVAGRLCAIAGIVIGLVLQAQWAVEFDKIGRQLYDISAPIDPADK